METQKQLIALSPLDGRYNKTMEPLAELFSEYGLIRYRYLVEVRYLRALLSQIEVDSSGLDKLDEEVSIEDAERVKEFERTTRHDVKAVEYFLSEKLGEANLSHLRQWVHFALTSEDVNNLAYGLMLKTALEQVLAPRMQELIAVISTLAQEHKHDVMLARTHGQPASPTTFGKEMAVFAHRLSGHLSELKELPIQGKLAGASGNYNAHVVAYPDLDWPQFSREFVESFGLEHKPLVTQIEGHDSWSRIFDALVRFNTVLIGFDQDVWRYISDGYLIQKPVKDEVGSSTMPHKVNPIDFENSEGNLELANSGLAFLSSKLLISRLQRDLTDSTVERNIGVYLGHSLLGYLSCLKGLGKIQVNSSQMIQEVEARPEILAEAMQTILRREGVKDAYEKMKDLTRGGAVTLNSLHEWIEALDIASDLKQELRGLKPSEYIGLAASLADLREVR